MNIGEESKLQRGLVLERLAIRPLGDCKLICITSPFIHLTLGFTAFPAMGWEVKYRGMRHVWSALSLREKHTQGRQLLKSHSGCFYISTKIKSLWKPHGRHGKSSQLWIWKLPCSDDTQTELRGMYMTLSGGNTGLARLSTVVSTSPSLSFRTRAALQDVQG